MCLIILVIVLLITVVYDVPDGEITASGAGSQIMNVDTPNDSHNVNDNNSDKNTPQTEDQFKFPNRTRARAPSKEVVSNKKIVTDSIPLQNRFNPLTSLPTAGSTQNQSTKVT
ncbi:hypothetical protein AVEN_176887-1 [Araneus ventricosus]|uniref:Uncharacterized protein n=1 Tax=Araneus ventricosus TaxID=182803 RepID=A0A4Y2ND77_ARAVE|nr:hypothetical protein AVEN_176887-1 [Araneus ventricosus]